MAMGPVTAPVIFIQIMKNLFIDMLDRGIVVFLENESIYSSMAEEHFKYLKKAFTYLCKYAFYCKLKKCSFLQNTTTFLGFKITPEGMHISDAKVKSLKE